MSKTSPVDMSLIVPVVVSTNMVRVPGLGGGGSVVSGGLFGGSGLFGAPAPNPYAQRGPSPAPGPPGYAPNPYAQHAQHAQQQQQQQQQNGADEAPQFSQAEQSKLFPWLQ